MMDILIKKSIGLDIADNSVEVAELIKSSGKVKINSLGRLRLRSGIVERGRIKDEIKLLQAVKKVFDEARPHSVPLIKATFGIPENLVFIQAAELKPRAQENFKKLSSQERRDFIRQEALKIMPLSEDDVIFNYRVRLVEEHKINVLIVAASRKEILKWQRFFQKINLAVVFDVESLAIFRGLFSRPIDTGLCLVDMGARTSQIMIYDKMGLRHSYQVNNAGRSLTKAIQNKLKNNFEEAEKIKIQSGISNKKSDIYPILTKQIELLNQEVKTLIKYYRRQTSNGVEEIILTGGSSRLKGLADFMRDDIGLPVSLGTSVLAQEKLSSPAQRFFFIEAIGLALRELDKKWPERDPVLEIKPEVVKTSKPVVTVSTEKQVVPLVKIDKPGKIEPKPETGETRNYKRLMSIFMTLLVVAVVLFAAIDWYTNNQQVKQEQANQEAASQALAVLNEAKQAKVVVPTTTEDIIESETAKKFLKITETPTGWLNVREGPGLNFQILTKVNPGDKFEILDEDADWFRIQFSADGFGWVFGEYIEEVTSN